MKTMPNKNKRTSKIITAVVLSMIFIVIFSGFYYYWQPKPTSPVQPPSVTFYQPSSVIDYFAERWQQPDVGTTLSPDESTLLYMSTGNFLIILFIGVGLVFFWSYQFVDLIQSRKVRRPIKGLYVFLFLLPPLLSPLGPTFWLFSKPRGRRR